MAATKTTICSETRAEALERTALEEVIELQPHRLSISELHLRIARDPDDQPEEEAIRLAIRELRSDGLLRYRSDDEIVEPTLPALSAFALLTA
jgi:hypothetical protein